MLITINNLLQACMYALYIYYSSLNFASVIHFHWSAGLVSRHVCKVGTLSIHACINFGHSFVTEILSVKANKFSTVPLEIFLQ